MPKAAAEIGAAEEILPLSHIAEAIARLVADGPNSFRSTGTITATPAENYEPFAFGFELHVRNDEICREPRA